MTQQADLTAFLAWLAKDKEYKLCRKSFGEYRLVRNDLSQLADEFLASRGRPQEDVASESSPAEAPTLYP